jgi:hypothetical protein
MAHNPRFSQILKELEEIHNQKNNDYAGAGKDPLANLREFGWKGGVVRISDKYFRLKNFAKSEKLSVKNETIIDTLNDLANYAILTRILYEDENKRH